MSGEAEMQSRLEQASAYELGELLRNASATSQATLRNLLGGACHSRLLGLAMRFRPPGGDRLSRGNVMIVPGFLGCSLTEFTDAGASRLWLDMSRIASGAFARLRLDSDGRSSAHDIRPSGVPACTYGALLLTLGERWNVRTFWYDWRKDFALAADELAGRAATWFGADEPFHIVAHSTGGLVARAYVQRHSRQWQARGGASRLIMLGTPQHGFYTACQMLSGLDVTLRKLAAAQQQGSLTEIVDTVRTFPSVYALLPSPLREPAAAAFYDAETWGAVRASQTHLNQAREFHESLVDCVDSQRMIQILGCHRPTIESVDDYQRLDEEEIYQINTHGDGLVPHALAELTTSQGVPIATYYVDEHHGNLPFHSDVVLAVGDLLACGETDTLAMIPPGARTARGARPWKAEIHRQQRSRFAAGLRSLRDWHVARQRSEETEFRGSRSAEFGTSAQRELGSWLASEFTGDESSLPSGSAAKLPSEPAAICIRLLHGGIETIGGEVDLAADDTPAVDAIAVGHYMGVRPQSAELALDKAISGRRGEEDRRLMLTELSERGVISGELGRTFFLPDPRQPALRTLAFAGMGLPGRLGVPELTVVVRELCWSLGRIGKRHLATVVIGAGGDNLHQPDAVSAWVRGIKLALSGTAIDDPFGLRCITFVCHSARALRRTQQTLQAEVRRLRKSRRLDISLTQWSEAALDAAEQRDTGRAKRKLTATLVASGQGGNAPEPEDRPPTRITATVDNETYRFGAITDTAAVPERDIPLDPLLVRQANRELVGHSLVEQYEAGCFLQRLLLPADFLDTLLTSAPLVLSLDPQTARIHWEMLSQAAFSGMSAMAPGASASNDSVRSLFWGTVRSLTRQLRTTFAPSPEPPPPAQRLLRVLIVADPAKDAPLAGAMEEGYEVAELFKRFNRVYRQGPNRVEVVCLLGPGEATRTAVLKHLMLRSYDVLHFAGHCHYDVEYPQRSGWLFSNSEKISVRELSRIDRVPSFIFSNACESGVTADRPERRDERLAPSFAEAVFARGVTNFVCTAWPVNDLAARSFARVLYTELLGLRDAYSDGDRGRTPQTLHVAMRRARESLAATPEGITTWGAYQHYGNPYHRFFQSVLEPMTNEAR